MGCFILNKKKFSPDMLSCCPFELENSNSCDINKIQKYIRQIITHELTDRQKEIICLYYYENKNVSEIAICLHVNPSTVSRSLARSRKNIFRILRYYF